MGAAHPEFIEVAVALPVTGTYTYGVPVGLAPFVSSGQRVLVPFGQRRVTGYVMGPAEPADRRQIKTILDVLDETPIFPVSMVPFFRWIAGYYFYPIGAGIKGALPGGLNLTEVHLLEITSKGRKTLAQQGLNPLESDILTCLQSSPIRLDHLHRRVGRKVPRALIHLLVTGGLVVKRSELKGGRVKARQERFVKFVRPPEPGDKLSPARERVMAVVREEGEVSVARLKARIPGSARHIAPLGKKGLLSVVYRRAYRDPFGEPIQPDTAPVLTGEQNRAISKVRAATERGFAAYLLAGVTGSGKTEVYMQLAEETIGRGSAVIVLVPEIALITQMERRFRARFGEHVAVLHSGLSAGERYDQWGRISKGEASIAIGARSAIFAPFTDIGMIVVDEEHDGSYKQEGGLRYNARDLAVVRARQNNAVVILGSATPSVQSYHNVTAGKFSRLALTRRVRQRSLPEVSVVDLRSARDARGTARYITQPLYKAMKEVLARGEQVLLFLNRRGYATYPVCAACGESLRCKNCDISLTLHLKTNAYRCHYCGFTRSALTGCPACGSSKIKRIGLGTEKLEIMVKELFPRASVARMDRDTTARKGSILKILKGLRNRSTDILVGTQMVTKGHDFPNITLVGIVCADLSLSFPDFRAGERTYQLLAQVSGRAGRGEVPGRVILQTYNPGHFSIRAAGDQDYEAFYRQETGFRKALSYPPYTRMVQLRISGKDKAKTRLCAETVGDLCRGLQGSSDFVRCVAVLGPIEAPMPKIAGRYRWQILLKGTLVKPLQGFLQRLMTEKAFVQAGRYVKVVVDVDPYFMS